MNKSNDFIIKDFQTFISAHKCERDAMTHTTLIKGQGARYCFTENNYQKFMKKYVDVINSEQDIDLHFVERVSSHGVTFLFIDVDFDQLKSKRTYQIEHIIQIIQKTNSFVKKNFKVKDNQLLSFVTEKPYPSFRDNSKTKNNTKMYKDGFHIYYPYLPMKEDYRYYTIDHLNETMINNGFLNGIEYKNNADTIFDTSIIKSNGILMMGSKKQGGSPYELTHIYNVDLNEMDTNEYDISELVYTLSNQRYDSDGSIEPIKNAMILHNINEISRQYNGGNKKKKGIVRQSVTKENLSGDDKSYDAEDCDANEGNFEKLKTNSPTKNIPNSKKSLGNMREIEMTIALMKILSKERAHEYKSWMRVGFALFSVDPTLFNYFVEFSKKDIEKYKRCNDIRGTSCENVWKMAKNYSEYYDAGTIRHWARLDNPVEYNKIIRKMNDAVFGRAETSKHVDIAQVIYELYKDRFVCVDIPKNKWYEFQNHKWVFVQSAYTLEELISDDVRKMMTMYCSEKMAASACNTEGFSNENDYRRYNKLMKAIDDLGNVPFRANVVRACASKFFDPEFQAKLDTNTYLVGFENGVYDLKELSFRDGLPTDYVSKTVGYDWINYKEDDPVFDKIYKYFSEVQTDEDMREYLLTFIASILRGVPDQKVHIWTGGGGNGKSATISLIKNMLGDYYGVVSITLLTKKRTDAGSATPELADKFGKRLLVIQEPEHNDVIYVGQMKELSGADTIQARPLYGDPFYYVPQFSMVLTCNNLPHIPATDDGTWRRLRVTPFESIFVDGKPKGPKQFKKDKQLVEEFPKWAQPMMWLAITKYYPVYKNGIDGTPFEISEPAKVIEQTKDYKKDSDVYTEFLEDTLKLTNDDNDVENIGFVYDGFRNWYSASRNEKAPERKLFVAYLKKNNYKIDKQYVYGVVFTLPLT